MTPKIGQKLTLRHGGHKPHLIEGQEYTVVKVEFGRFITDRCSSGNADCVCQVSGWTWDRNFDFVRPRIKSGDSVIWQNGTSSHFKENFEYVVKTVIDAPNYYQKFTVIACEAMKSGYGCECGSGREWVYNQDFVGIKTEPDITPEDAMKALSLPSPADVASFFGVKL